MGPPSGLSTRARGYIRSVMSSQTGAHSRIGPHYGLMERVGGRLLPKAPGGRFYQLIRCDALTASCRSSSSPCT